MASAHSDAGHAVYTPRLLRVYDTTVLGLSNRLLWRCPVSVVRAQYDSLAGAVHLDVGPGTGYHLDHCRFPVDAPELTVVDANAHVLEHVSRRLARYQPTVVRADIRQPLPLPSAQFESIGLGYVLHCLPGPMVVKGEVLEHLVRLLAPGGVLFGSTILGDDTLHTRTSRAVMRLYNRRGIFGNAEDDLVSLRAALASTFASCDVELRGSVALFAGWAA
jgi:SAM-dependent methyltransferase